MNYRKHILFSLMPMLAASFAGSMSAKTSITATLDSAYIIMGNVTGLTIEVVEPVTAQSNVGIIPETMPREVEIVGEVSNDTTNLNDNTRQIIRKLIIQSFDSGAYTLPPVIYQSGNDTLLSNTVTLKVNPVDVSGLEDIHANADTLKLPSKWYDFLPDWIIDYWGWLLLTLIIVAGGVCGVLIYTKRMAVPFIPAKKPVPPYEMAKKRLETLHDQHLCEKGQEREYYTELTDILREYIDKRFGINAMEMTSGQILSHLNANPATRPSERLMRQILEVADFVKFAKLRPMPEDNNKAFASAMEFVDNTRPVEEENTEETETETENKE